MAGEYLDAIPGTESWPRAAARTPVPHARQAGLLERLPVLLPAPAEPVEEAENLVGYRLPSLLRRLYLEAGNGGSARPRNARTERRPPGRRRPGSAGSSSRGAQRLVPALVVPARKPAAYLLLGLRNLLIHRLLPAAGAYMGLGTQPRPGGPAGAFPAASVPGRVARPVGPLRALSWSGPWSAIPTRGGGAERRSRSTHSGQPRWQTRRADGAATSGQRRCRQRTRPAVDPRSRSLRSDLGRRAG